MCPSLIPPPSRCTRALQGAPTPRTTPRRAPSSSRSSRATDPARGRPGRPRRPRRHGLKVLRNSLSSAPRHSRTPCAQGFVVRSIRAAVTTSAIRACRRARAARTVLAPKMDVPRKLFATPRPDSPTPTRQTAGAVSGVGALAPSSRCSTTSYLLSGDSSASRLTSLPWTVKLPGWRSGWNSVPVQVNPQSEGKPMAPHGWLDFSAWRTNVHCWNSWHWCALCLFGRPELG